MNDLFQTSVEDDANAFEREGPLELDAVGAEEVHAMTAVLETARNNRQPAPPMRAVAPDETQGEDPLTEWLSGVTIGAAVASADAGGGDPFPLTNKLLLRFGAGQSGPRYVRIDTEESYADLAAEHSPALAELRARVDQLTEAFQQHAANPRAHEALVEEAADLEVLGAEHAEEEADKAIDMVLPAWAEGKVKAWRQEGDICATIALPGPDGRLRLCTAVMPVEDAVEEASRHATEADVDASEVLGALPAIGCVLGAATLVKEMCSAAPSILGRPEVATNDSCILCIEPKANPALAALMALLCACASGDQQALDEWKRLADAVKRGGADIVAQAMNEAHVRVSKVLH